ncbi:MAG: hypothetical protein CM1200mP10_22000 [Candidatus Neomarinimicrobiota bacterium]|nr:MAG: hypothetical protein CM1200mP10_22000 [Candidatus Neomarinimicrobiota bacterium]
MASFRVQNLAVILNGLIPKKNMTINFCRGSRKDFRNAVVAARSAFKAWSSRSAYNRGQILYRIAEMMESRREQFKSELILQGFTKKTIRERSSP